MHIAQNDQKVSMSTIFCQNTLDKVNRRLKLKKIIQLHRSLLPGCSNSQKKEKS